MDIREYSLDIGDQKLLLQFGKFAQAVDTSVYAQLGDTAVLVTVAVGQESPDIDHFPLTVEYVEKLYAGGLIKGSRWVKREGRPSDQAILTSRAIDRSVRPLFPKTYKKQVQIVVTLLSIDGVNDPVVLSCLATSAALAVSSVPWKGPISTLRIGYVSFEKNGESQLILNPTETEEDFSTLDLLVSTTKEKVLMIETKARMIAEEIIEDGIEMAKREGKRIIEFFKKIAQEIGRPKDTTPPEPDYSEIFQLIEKKYASLIDLGLKEAIQIAGKEEKIIQEVITSLHQDLNQRYSLSFITTAVRKYQFDLIRKSILEKDLRPDKRKFDEMRKLHIEVSVLPRTHGSAIFQRGQTQILSITTLGSITLEQLIEGPEGKVAKRYIHHYSDAPYSYGQVGKISSPSRRAIGHGALAEKAIEPVLPKEEEFPYAIRVVSEILSENGSSSMGSVCGSSLSLMDAGVPLKEPVAGVAMGLMSRSDDDYVILTDIIGLEDFSGEMDFKIAGTKTGITAIQLDVKNEGLTRKMIHDTFIQAREARLAILEAMNKVIDRPRREISQYAPKVVVLTPPVDKIGEIIGPGGKNIRALISRTQVDFNVDEEGRVTICGLDREKVDEAVEYVNNIIRKVEVGDEFVGEVKRILKFGAFVEILPGREGLIHVSKMGRGFVRNPFNILRVGQKVRVRVYHIDDLGRINLELF
ncbi:MAG: polyribonucleotide nucleotidyltransferase [Patescibacteria group bacterium]|nr:polyribonucleotide nucleotidyltransferase [Patescibacteria group bacterium]